MPKIEVLTIPATTFTMRVEGKTVHVAIPEVTIPQDKIADVISEYVKVLASQTARYAAVKAAARAEEFEQEVRSHLQMAESLLGRKLSLEEVTNIRKRVAEARNFHGIDVIKIDVDVLKNRLGL